MIIQCKVMLKLCSESVIISFKASTKELSMFCCIAFGYCHGKAYAFSCWL
jgi:hypothetical protein